MKITNTGNIPLALGVWLLHDEYDYQSMANYISATRLMKPLRALILAARVPPDQQVSDLEDYISRAYGHSLHDSIEKAWTNDKARNNGLRQLGYPEHVIERILVNPTKEQLAAKPDAIPVYLEQRCFKKVVIMGVEYTIGGKFDMVAEGIVHDNKSTTAYAWLFGGKDDDYQLQGSIYRWLEPEKITEDFIRINFLFTDWQKLQARTNPAYPQKRVEFKDIRLKDIRDTDSWVRNKITMFEKYKNSPDEEIPECTPEELWMSEPVYKYYSDPSKTTGKSTKNFNDPGEANQWWQVEKGGKGIVITIPGTPKRCEYCEAAPVCKQRLKYL
ncbi:putative RecB family exonuclease [Erwinia phage Fifi067]|nr:putative RecB family exonuclease [Erwinia phage Fifi067]WBQ32518.1 putative exonuclease [Erwinia phage Kuerle]